MIKRELYMQQLRNFIDKPVIKVVTGMRRSGKSALLELLKEELIENGISENDILYINFESLQYEHLTEYGAFYDYVKEFAQNKKLYILLDEIQNVKSWEKAVNSFRVDFNCDIYITGSNASLLSGELATLIAGRYIEIKLYPLSFKEYLEFASQNDDETRITEQQHFMNYLQFGGLPGIHHMTWEEAPLNGYLIDIYNSVLLKDVVSRNNIRDTELLSKIVTYIMDNIGNIFSAKTISDFLKNQGRKLSAETIYNYLKTLEDALIIHKVKRYDIKGKRHLETLEKFYMSDLGMRNAVLGFSMNDISGMLENVVYLELLRRGYHVSIGKQDTSEVDFVADKGNERIYIQVAYLLASESIIKREFGAFCDIKDNYPKIVLSLDDFNMSRDGYLHMNLREFLLG